MQLDGKPMKIEIIGTNSEIPASARVNVVGGVNGRRTVAMYVLFSHVIYHCVLSISQFYAFIKWCLCPS